MIMEFLVENGFGRISLKLDMIGQMKRTKTEVER